MMVLMVADPRAFSATYRFLAVGSFDRGVGAFPFDAVPLLALQLRAREWNHGGILQLLGRK